MQLNFDSTLRTLSALVAGVIEDKQPAARGLGFACVRAAFGLTDEQLSLLIQLDLEALSERLVQQGEAPLTDEQIGASTAKRFDAIDAYAPAVAALGDAFDALNSIWMTGVTKDGKPRQSPLNRGQFLDGGAIAAPQDALAAFGLEGRS